MEYQWSWLWLRGCKGQSLSLLLSTKCELGKALNIESFGWPFVVGLGCESMKHLIAYPSNVCVEGLIGPGQLQNRNQD